jgi:amino acid adenylation domain-containing protein/non-ribosomal peptide synthase protein (TIGR01720 family)
LSELRRRDIRIWAEGDRLKYEAPSGALTDDLLGLLRLHKEDILKSAAADLTAARGGAFSLVSDEDRQKLPPDLEDAYPLSMLQAGMVFHSEHTPGTYHSVISYQVQTRIDLGAVQTALEQVVTRHPMLRTEINLNDYSEPLQLVHAEAGVTLRVYDLRGLSDAEQEEALWDWLETEKRRPFNWNSYPLISFHVHLRGEDRAQFTFVSPHAICDGWSDNLFITELFTRYQSLLRGEAVAVVAPPSSPFRDFVALEQEALASPECREFWDRLLSDCSYTKVPRLADAAPHAGVPRTRHHELNIPAEVSDKLREVALGAAVPLKSVLLAVHLKVISVLTGRPDVLTGLITHGRPEQADGDKVIGLFLNALPFRLSLPAGSWLDFVRQTFEAESEMLPYRRYPMAQIQKDVGQQTLFDTLFTYIHFHTSEGPRGGGDIKVLDAVGVGETNFPLGVTFIVDPYTQKIKLTFDSNLNEIADEQLEAIHGYYERALAALALDPHAPIRTANLLSARELHTLLEEWNAAGGEAAPGACVHHLFERQVALTPDASALSFAGREMSYCELDDRADRLARHLRALGVRRGTLVGLCVERSPEMIVGLLGVLKAGGAYLPLDPSYPLERLAFMIEDAQAPVLLTLSHLADALPPFWGQTLCLDEDREEVARESDQSLEVAVTPDDLAYVIYTSGSTGRPKGVLVEHRGVCLLAAAQAPAFGLRGGVRQLQFASPGFDASVSEIFTALLSGATLVLAGRDKLLPGPELLGLLRRERIHTVTLPPTLLSALEADDLPELRVVVAAGESCGAEAVSQWLGGGARRFLNAYGPTEATVCATMGELRGDGRVSIGRPLAHARVYVLNGLGEPVPVGVTGELYVGGGGVARGYLNRPGLTAERFVPDPFSVEPGARLYRTGDVVRWLPTGALEFVGRLDRQVKVRGFRIELGEVEGIINEHSAVRESVVVVREDKPGERRLVGYVLTRREVSGAELREYVRERLPEYMVPSALLVLDEFPLNTSGKVNRKALPAPEHSRDEAADSFVAPRDATEELLAGIWSQVLGIERVGVHDNFLELGGDSILSIQITARATQAGVRLTTKQIFEHLTIAELAVVAGDARVVSAEQETVTGELPLTPIQHWFFGQEMPDPHHYNQSLMFELRQPVELALLERALTHLTTHHDALRLRFRREAEGWRQRMAEADEAVVAVIRHDFSELEAAVGRAADEVQRSLDLEHGPIIRVALFDGGAGSPARLLFVIHHLAVDSVSWRILLEDLQTAYGQLEAGETVRLPAKTTSFKRWAEALDEYAGSEDLEAELEYWERMGSERVVALPVEKNAGEDTQASAANVSVSLGREQTQRLLKEVPAAYGTQINDVLLLALARAFNDWTGERSLLVEMEGHGREEVVEGIDVSRTVGWFTSIYPVLLTLGGGGIGEELKGVKERLRGIPGRGLGHGLLLHVGSADARRRLGALPRAGVSFNYSGQFDQALDGEGMLGAPGGPIGEPFSRRAKRSHPLSVNSYVVEGRLQVVLTYSENRHERETIERLGESYARELEAIIAHCASAEAGGHTPSDFPLARLGQEALDRVTQPYGKVEDIYPLAPLQQGLLFHTIYAPTSGTYIEQLNCRLEGELNVRAFKEAWQRAIDRHTIFRTAFVWEGLDAPLQVVCKEAGLLWQEEDWSGLAESGWQERLASFLEAEARRDFDLSRPPLMRFVLLRRGDDSYEFVWSHHHLLMDGWCTSLLLNEVFRLYEAFCKGEDARLERVYPYRDYIAWLLKQDQSKAERFWRETLKGFTSPTQITAGGSGADGDGGEEAGEEEILLPTELSARLQAFAQGHQLTLNTMVQGAWALLLSRYSGEDDVVFGVTVSGRPAELVGIETRIGLFINALPLRVSVSADEALVPWLRQLQRHLTDLRQYEYSSLSQIQGWSEVPNGQQLFDSLLVFQNYPVDRSLSEKKVGLRAGAVNTIHKTNYPITLTAVPGERILLQVSYDGPRFDGATADRMLGHLRRLLEGFASDAGRRLSELPILTEREQRQILFDWNRTAHEYAADVCVHELIEERAAQSPEAAAVAFEDQRLTYGELNGRANRLARRLRALGVGPDVLVAVCLERSPELLVAILATLKAGGAYLPLDPTYPLERLAFMIEDAQAPVLLTTEALAGGLPSHWGQTVCLDSDREEIERESDENLEAVAAADNLAYAIYTSGSTGRPKAVQVTHRNLLHLLAAREHYFPEPVGGLLLLSSVAFDMAVVGTFWTLTQGGTLVLPREGAQTDVERLAGLVDENSVSHLIAVPSLWGLLLEQAAGGSLSSLRTVVVAGEVCPAGLVRHHQESLPRAALFNEYGPTEATVWSSVYECRLGARGGAVPIGRPAANVRLYILDGRGEPVPVGAAGELYVGGGGVARGYLGRPELTAERFVPDPFGQEPGGRLYRTGDLARYLADSNIEFVGRADHQVKVRGYRIEPGEVEAALTQHEGVGECVVMAREDAPGEKRLVAYLAAAPEAEISVAGVRTYLGEKLPGYMVPAAFVVLESLPRLPGGKVDRRALPAPEEASSARDETPFVAPRTATERALAEVWSQVLGKEGVGIDDSFFALGGDSIRSIQVLSRAKERGLNFSLPQIFEHSTIRRLARQVESADACDTAPPPSEPFSLISEADRRQMPDDVEDAYPLTMLQAGMVFHSELNPELAIYQNTFSIRMEMPFDFDCLNEAVGQLAARHTLLRTYFDLHNFSQPLQLVRKTFSLPLTVDDLRHLPPAEQDREIRDWLEREKESRINWAEPPLLRLHLHRCGDDVFQFSRTEHHAVCDGWSVATMLTELFQHYYYLLGKDDLKVDLTPPPPFRDYVALELEVLKSEEARRYWQRKLGDPTIVRLPKRITPESAADAKYAAGLVVPISPETSAGLGRLAQRAGVPVKSVVLAAHLKVLSLLSGQGDVITGLISNGRPETNDGERMFGLFLNTLPFRLNLGGGSWLDLVEEAFGGERELLPFRRYPLAQLQRMHQGQPLFDTAFNFTHFHVAERLEKVTGSRVLDSYGFQRTNFPLLAEFSLSVSVEQVHLSLHYDPSWLSGEQLERIGRYYAEALRQMAETPDAEHVGRTLLGDEERHKLLVEWNDTQAGFSKERLIHELIEEQVARTPDALAVVWGAERLSYAEVNARANRLARYLMSLGVGAEDAVGVCMGRSAELPVALLGVLKAGAAYVPLDPSYPKQRLGFITQEARLRAVLTETALREVVSGLEVEAVCVDERREAVAAMSAENLAPRSLPSNLAYVIYTSGSTGRPKGVAIEHRNAVVMLQWGVEYYGAGQLGGVLASTSINFDMSVFELFAPLTCGGRVIGAENALELARLAEAREVTLVNTVPSAMKELVRGGAVPETVRIVNLGGEALPRTLVNGVYSLGHVEAVYNLYGPTEDTTYTTCALVPRGEDAPVTVGRQISNTQIYILDAALRPVPVGVAGEMYIGGDGLSRGYLNRPDLTAEKFLPNPFSREPGARLYRIGDLGRWREDGEIEYLGRLDHQVKIRGYRVELGEIEAALARHEGVGECVVVARTDAAGAARLVAYVVARTGASASTEQLRGHLKERLPDYMLPSFFMLLDALPLNPNGKLERAALPAPTEARPAIDTDYEAPRNLVEEELASIWANVLKVERVGMNDDFFELGGHSLLATQIMSHVREAFDVDLPLRSLFESPTVANLALTIVQGRGELAGADELAPMLERLESLSEEEVQAMLAGEGELTGEGK